MTQEQKPESAEFRTREEQIGALALAMDAAYPRTVAEMHISEAEARGAAEQRRKDAERAEPVAWQYEVKGLGEWQNGEVGYGPDVWRLKCGYIKPDRDDPDYRSLSPLYDHPANVATLEARVKELEGEGERRIAEAVAAERERCAEVCLSLRMVDFSLPESWFNDGCKASAAAIREGGEND